MALADGTIDVLSSGHDPRGPEEKRLPFADSEPGMSGAETLFALSMTLVYAGVIDLERLFALLAANPARVLGLKAGALAPGTPADLILVDPAAPWRISNARMVAKAGNTPFDGLPRPGQGAARLERRNRDPRLARGDLRPAAHPARQRIAGRGAHEARTTTGLDRAAQRIGVTPREPAHRQAIEIARLGRDARAIGVCWLSSGTRRALRRQASRAIARLA